VLLVQDTNEFDPSLRARLVDAAGSDRTLREGKNDFASIETDGGATAGCKLLLMP
jgi:hypothetical protein